RRQGRGYALPLLGIKPVSSRRYDFRLAHWTIGDGAWGRSMTVRTLALLALVLVAGAPPAQAQPPETVFLEELTWTELRDLIDSGKTTIIVPIGGTEQNGPDMALGKHNVRVKALSEKIALALGNALVAPVIAYVPEGGVSPPTAHMRFPGTITIPD